MPEKKEYFYKLQYRLYLENCYGRLEFISLYFVFFYIFVKLEEHRGHGGRS